MRGMDVPEIKVVKPDVFTRAQRKNGGFKFYMNNQLCGFVSPFSLSRYSKVVWKVNFEVFLTQGIDSDGDKYARNMGTVKRGGPVAITRVEALEFHLALVTQLLMGLSGSIGGSCS